jgi:glycosyltransferase involved in cell wall biosynthesis
VNILWIPHAPWRTPQRARFFAEELALRHTLHVTDYDAEFTQLRHFASRRYAQNFFPRQWQDASVTVHHVPRVSPALFSRRLRQLNARWFSELLARLTERHRIDVVVGTFVAPVPTDVPTVTDVFDDNAGFWQSYGPNKGYAQEIAASEQAWIGHSRAVVTVSSVLADQVRGRSPGKRVVHVPNPVDLSRYAPDRQVARAALGLKAGTTYIGNIGALDHEHEARRLLAVAERLRGVPGTELLVVGRGAAMPLLEREAASAGLTNLRFAGFLSGPALVQHFQALDIGLCPYSGASAGDHARVPMRLLHYSATGSRVVCTRLDEVERMGFGNVSLTGDSDAAFAGGVLAALDQPGQVPAQIEQYDQARLGQVYEGVLKQCLEAPDQGAASNTADARTVAQ